MHEIFYCQFQEFDTPEGSGNYTDYLKNVFLNPTNPEISFTEKHDDEAKDSSVTAVACPAMGSPNGGVSTTIISTEELHLPSSSNLESGEFYILVLYSACDEIIVHIETDK